MEQVNWGIIGCGDVTEIKSGPAFNKVTGSRLVQVMRRDGDKAQDYAQRHGVPIWTDDAAELIHNPKINAVYVATPPDSHATYTIAAAQAGKAVYVEKPMALNYGQCREMIATCEEAQVPLFVAYYRRCLPSYRKIKELIDQGTIGTIRTVHIQMIRSLEDLDPSLPPPWRLRPELSGGGHFVDLASHQLDFLDYLFGPIESVEGRAANQAGAYPAEDIVCASFSFAKGVLGTGNWCFSAAPVCEQDVTEIVGNRGRIAFSTFGHEVPLTLETSQGRETFSFAALTHIQQPMIETVVATLRGEETCPSTGVSGARTTWVMDRILSDQRGG